jgi:carbamoyl-phosphate synthase large subunit
VFVHNPSPLTFTPPHTRRTFLDKVVEVKTSGESTPYDFVRDKTSDRSVRKVVILGSGGLQIGQAGEFDYSGAQAIKAFKEEGIETVLINPNIATIQTGRGMADKVYFLPVTQEYIERVFELERPDSIVLGFGGQTALNTGVELEAAGVLEKYNVRVLGTPVSTIRTAEDRERFNAALAEIDVDFARSEPAETVEDAVRIGNEIGFPVMIRSAYSLGGLGSGICEDEADLRERATKALAVCPQVLVEESLKGWKEVEYEVVRDAYDNCVTVCNMENFDPMGIHTGESIVIAPSQTLTNEEYYNLRSVAIKVIRHLGIIGECNIQYTLDPHSQQYRVIEVNPRLSRSSALASKATGYPLAAVAARLGLGIPLPDIRNSVTRTTTACFEPSLDYCVVKMPRWDLGKFARVDPSIGTVMKSVGEVMAVGRNFGEALQKAVRMVGGEAVGGFEGKGFDSARVRRELEHPTADRIFALADAMTSGEVSLDEIRDITGIDRWWLRGLEELVQVRGQLQKHTLRGAPRELVRRAKVLGFSDRQLARHLQVGEDEVEASADGAGAAGSTRAELERELRVRKRRQELLITPYVKQIDTLAAEFPAYTNYLYVTYDAAAHDLPVHDPTAQRVMVLGSGCYRIGSSVEFDWCTVGTARALRSAGVGTVIVNYNPETVSTDYDESDRLYFEELSFERVMDIYEAEMARGVVVSMGGQEPQNIALRLAQAGARVLGTSPNDIDRAEDRQKFSSMLDNVGIDQPRWAELTSVDDARRFAEEVGYPLLIRPSYVLSGAAMAVAHTPEQLEAMLGNAAAVSDEYPVVMTRFHDGCKEVEVDAVARAGTLINWAVSEHVEDAGVHSGDATMVFPADTLPDAVRTRAIDIAARIAKELNISGPCNTQMLWDPRADTLKVIETNLRAARSFPMVSKALGIDFVETATRIFLDDGSEGAAAANRAAAEAAAAADAARVPVPEFSVAAADPTTAAGGSSCSEAAHMLRRMTSSANKPGLGQALSTEPLRPDARCDEKLPYLLVKAPMFSFMRLAGADPQLGVEMKSTGEVAAFGRTRAEALVLAMVSARGYRWPVARCVVALGPDTGSATSTSASTAGAAGAAKGKAGTNGAPSHASRVWEIVEALAAARAQGGMEVVAASPDTARLLEAAGCTVDSTCPMGLARVAGGEARDEVDDQSAVGLVRASSSTDFDGGVDLVIDLADRGDTTSELAHAHYLLRRSAADFGVGLITDGGLARAFLEGIAQFNKNPLPVKAWDEYLKEAPYKTYLS